MGAEQSALRRRGLHPDLADAIMTRALLQALSDVSLGESGGSQMRDHAWDPQDCSPPFIILPDGLTARRRPSMLTSDCIRGKKGYRQGRHVWEIQWENDERGSFAIVGIATPNAPLQTIGYQPVIGTNAESWGWDIVNKKLLHDGKISDYPAGISTLGFRVPDTFYAILDMNQLTLSFAVNDVHLGVAFKQLPKQNNRPLCPIANAIFGNCDIRMRYMGEGEAVISRLKHPFAKLNRSVSEVHSLPHSKTEDSRRRSTGSHAGLPPQDVILPASKRYKFSYMHGDNATVTCGGKKAKRKNALSAFSGATVMVSEPLVDNELFEIRVDSIVSRWVGGLSLGAVPKDPNSFPFPSSLPEYKKDLFMWCANKIVFCSSMEESVRENIVEINIGDRVGVMRQPDDTLHFFKNGKDIGKRFGKVPKTLYAVVDIFGQAEEVTITGGAAETQTSNDTGANQKPNSVSIMVQMKHVIDLLKAPVSDDLPPIIAKLAQDVFQPYVDNPDQSTRQKFGDHLVDVGAVLVLQKLLGRIDDTGIETQVGWLGMNIVTAILWNYSDASLKMATAIGQCGLLKRFADDLKRIGPETIRNKKKAYIVSSAVNILHNCAKATENRQAFRNIGAVQILVPFLKAENSETVTSALLALSYITDDSQKDLLKTDTKTIGILRGMLANATNNANLRGSLQDSSWSALEIVTGIANTAVNQSNCEMFVDSDVIPLMFTIIEKGGLIEKESAANALWILASSENGKQKIRSHAGAAVLLKDLSKHSNKNVASSAERVLLRIAQLPLQQDEFLEKSHDKCYCTKCHASRNEKLYYTQGEPSKDYALPTGWCRFALKISPQAKVHGAPLKWHVAYHGTSPSSVKPILDCGQLLIPGDTAFGGKKLSEVDGHFNDDKKPEGFNTKQVFVSPSIRYSGSEVYAKTQMFTHPETNKNYKAKAVFQLWIRPDSYKVGPQTIGANEEIDPKFSNQEIEWFTVERGAVHLYGLLIQLEE